jgi:hypothetical protein
MAESKSDNFSLEINAHSEKIAKFDPLSTNRLAADSEYRSTFALREVWPLSPSPELPHLSACIGNGP